MDLGFERRGRFLADRLMPSSKLNVKLQQGVTDVKKSRRQYQDWPELECSLNDKIIFQEASISRAPTKLAFRDIFQDL